MTAVQDNAQGGFKSEVTLSDNSNVSKEAKEAPPAEPSEEEFDRQLHKLLLHQREVRNRAKRKYEKKRYYEDEAYRRNLISTNNMKVRERCLQDPEYAEKLKKYKRDYMARKRAEAKLSQTVLRKPT